MICLLPAACTISSKTTDYCNHDIAIMMCQGFRCRPFLLTFYYPIATQVHSGHFSTIYCHITYLPKEAIKKACQKAILRTFFIIRLFLKDYVVPTVAV